MQCVEFEDRLNRLLDSRLAPEDDEQLSHHAHSCESCASALAAQRRLFVGLRASRPLPPADLADRVLSRRHSEVQTSRATWRNLTWAVLLASAASIGGLALMALKARDDANLAQPPALPSPQQPTPKRHAIAVTTPAPVPKTHENSPEKIDDDERFDEYFVALENLATQIGESKEFDEVSDSLTPSIKPIRSSFGLAIDALRRTLPRGKEPRTTKPDSGARFTLDSPAVA